MDFQNLCELADKEIRLGMHDRTLMTKAETEAGGVRAHAHQIYWRLRAAAIQEEETKSSGSYASQLSSRLESEEKKKKRHYALVKRTIKVGEEVVIETDAPDGGRGVVFEDDGRTGYFYARDYSVPDQLFVDALHIYSLKEVVDAHIPSEVHILWSDDGMKAVLILNRHPHAAFDFSTKCGYSRDQFPDPDPKTGWRHEPWSVSLRSYFFPETE